MNPLSSPLVRIMLGAAISTYLTPRVLVWAAPTLGGVINPKTGRFALSGDSTPEQIKVATQAVIGTSALITTLVFAGIGMAMGETPQQALAKAEGKVAA